MSAAAALCLLIRCAGCSQGDGGSPAPADVVTLNYYTIGEPDRDLAQVNEALNRILLKQYGFQVNYQKVSWNEYEKFLSTLINTNQPFDIAFTWTDNYQTGAQSGAWLELTPYLQAEGAAMYEAFNDAAQESALLGFMADYTAYADVFEEVSGIYEKYYSALITGTVDPDIYIPKMNQELSEAGLDLLRQELQRQINDWLQAPMDIDG